MTLTISFFITNFLLGVGLAMDAFSVSLANGLNEPNLCKKRICLIAGTFAIFQFFMPLIGYFCVSFLAKLFVVLQKFIPFISLILLCYIGGKMILESIKEIRNNNDDDSSDDCEKSDNDVKVSKISFKLLLLQGVATSIDALSVGFTISTYTIFQAFLASFLIGLVTFIICIGGIIIGKKAGTKLSAKAGIFGGIILILIGINIFV